MKMEAIKKKTLEIFDKYFKDDYILFLFGSFSKNKSDITSDIDLAVYSSQKISPILLLQIKEELENKLYILKDIDLINLTNRNINKELLRNILKEGILWKKSKNYKELLRSLKKRSENLKK
jgi:predicted nucleotidyltransferase